MADPIVGNVSDILNATKVVKQKKNGNDLGKDDFLKILITQMKYQDPSQPMQDKEFIAQMAQFTSVEQLSNMAGEMKLLRQSLGMASGLIGQSVTWLGKDELGYSVTKSGIVDSITFKDDKQWINVKGEAITLDQLTKIENAGGAAE
ncbi:flagellar hook capping FlgD N-terminal domain-containing protein [Paenibacillus eucommiae]|uniref:Flagellar basal-body rod modification protein FlgD n=1 Tax=Paenibacillus eucommiae TaxID=1355755 RepID=A0ABS4IXP8_9BACL|nr:flagellar hook capping FlgD N-terminal domain-containing protein [Paenibacillus eucommiae]MBP1991334.1 flagellar basal-body rod modification protein FlgD [Paenibacillus eucommiae]